mmetsp:Transcript_23068/g.47014  ORF Transcript_23068/g.47014 Transcript_23068/m.47014 type:complete len:433 (-) Transcript_23068:73-1371(-)
MHALTHSNLFLFCLVFPRVLCLFVCLLTDTMQHESMRHATALPGLHHDCHFDGRRLYRPGLRLRGIVHLPPHFGTGRGGPLLRDHHDRGGHFHPAQPGLQFCAHFGGIRGRNRHGTGAGRRPHRPARCQSDLLSGGGVLLDAGGCQFDTAGRDTKETESGVSVATTTATATATATQHAKLSKFRPRGKEHEIYGCSEPVSTLSGTAGRRTGRRRSGPVGAAVRCSASTRCICICIVVSSKIIGTTTPTTTAAKRSSGSGRRSFRKLRLVMAFLCTLSLAVSVTIFLWHGFLTELWAQTDAPTGDGRKANANANNQPAAVAVEVNTTTTTTTTTTTGSATDNKNKFKSEIESGTSGIVRDKTNGTGTNNIKNGGIQSGTNKRKMELELEPERITTPTTTTESMESKPEPMRRKMELEPELMTTIVEPKAEPAA